MVPVAGGMCFAGAHPATVRISMRLDGEEMFWALACETHQDDALSVDVSGW